MLSCSRVAADGDLYGDTLSCREGSNAVDAAFVTVPISGSGWPGSRGGISNSMESVGAPAAVKIIFL